jgi:hypothetical protein
VPVDSEVITGETDSRTESSDLISLAILFKVSKKNETENVTTMWGDITFSAVKHRPSAARKGQLEHSEPQLSNELKMSVLGRLSS